MSTQLRLAPNPIPAPLESVKICHARVHSIALRQAVELISSHAAASQGPAYVVTPNAQHLVLLERNQHFRETYWHASLVPPDGFSLLLAARLAGTRLKERVSGVDLAVLIRHALFNPRWMSKGCAFLRRWHPLCCTARLRTGRSSLGLCEHTRTGFKTSLWPFGTKVLPAPTGGFEMGCNERRYLPE
jgi:hypothetical protein